MGMEEECKIFGNSFSSDALKKDDPGYLLGRRVLQGDIGRGHDASLYLLGVSVPFHRYFSAGDTPLYLYVLRGYSVSIFSLIMEVGGANTPDRDHLGPHSQISPTGFPGSKDG